MTFPLLPKPDPLGCYKCGLLYGSNSWIDAVVPDEVWRQISPTADEGGLLCISCMAMRCAMLGLRCDIMLCSGPFVGRPCITRRQ